MDFQIETLTYSTSLLTIDETKIIRPIHISNCNLATNKIESPIWRTLYFFIICFIIKKYTLNCCV